MCKKIQQNVLVNHNSGKHSLISEKTLAKNLSQIKQNLFFCVIVKEGGVKINCNRMSKYFHLL